MKSKYFSTMISLLLLLGFASEVGLCIGPADTLRNEIGEIIPIPPAGQAGVDYIDLELMAHFKPGYLTLPPGTSEAPLTQCTVETNLENLLIYYKVHYVKQVFTGSQPGDTIRIVDSDTCYVPDLSQIYLLLQKLGADVLSAVEDLYSHEATLYAEPNYIRSINREPDDTYWGSQWNLKDGNNGIGCPLAWNSTVGSPSVKLGIIDTGVNYNHDDLGGPGFPNSKVAGGYDYADGDNNPMDYCGSDGHGSQCGGIAGALTNNNSSVAGIAGGWNQGGNDIGVQLYALKIFHNNCSWGGDNAAADAIRQGADPNHFGCRILSNSWGGYYWSETIRYAMRFAYSVGASFVASKGNDGSGDPHYPSDYDYSWVSAVASYGQNGRYCEPYNCGYTSNFGGGIDITAPGTQVPSTDRLGGTDESFGGTSAACPHVSGSIALVRTLEDGLRNEDTDWILKYSAWDDMEDSDNDVWTWHEHYGHGDLRVSTAIYRIKFPFGTSMMDFYQHTATGGYDVGHTDYLQYLFFGSPLNGRYFVKRYDVRVDVTYPEKFSGTPYVWGLGHNTAGWSAANPSHQVGYCRLVPGSQTSTGCQLQTFVYDVYSWPWGTPLGWYPCAPNQVSLQYKIWGIKIPDTPTGPGGGKISGETIPQEVSITGNYPNPFNSSTSIEFGIPEDGHVSFVIYDLLGRKINILVDKSMSAGYHSINWDGKDSDGVDAPSGIYFGRFAANGEVETEKMTVLR